MRTKKIFLGFTAILAVGVATAACSGDDDDDGGSYSLNNGEYSLDIIDVPTNTCWPVSNPLPIDLTNLPVSVSITSANGTSFVLVALPPADAFVPPVDGTINGNDITASGAVNNVALDTSGCNISITADAVGELTGDDEFNIDLTANLTIPGTSATACSQYVGEAIPGSDNLVPWPTLTAGSSGTCQLVLNADGFVDE